MLPVSNVQRDQAGDEAFRARYDAKIAERFAGAPADPFETGHATPYSDVRFATGTVTYGGGTLFVQVAEEFVRDAGGDAEALIREEAFIVLTNSGNREPDAFTRIEPNA